MRAADKKKQTNEGRYRNNVILNENMELIRNEGKIEIMKIYYEMR